MTPPSQAAEVSSGTPGLGAAAHAHHSAGALLASPARLQRLLAFASLVVLLVAFSLASDNFLQADNLVSILQATAVNGVLAIACTLVIISGGIDLSVGCLMTFCAVLAGVVLTGGGLPLPLGVAAAIGGGALCGGLSGWLVAQLRVPAFIATLGMMMLLKGLSLVISGSKPIYFLDTAGFDALTQGSLIGALLPALPLPNSVLVLFAVALGAGALLGQTLFGRYIFALGSNEEAARLSGLPVRRWKVAVYALGGGLCGVAGLLMASRLNSAQPALGQGYELEAIAAVVIGGTSLSGGRGSVLGTLIGAFIMSVLANGLRLMNVTQEWQTAVTGIIIVLAVYVDRLRQGHD